jgi:patatin-like phospholipase/acyl hydrolase
MKKILSIDGGGIRGIIPAMLIAEIERRTGKPACELFDLIAGTSTGGILALALAAADENDRPKYSAKTLIGIYDRRGKDIFQRSFWQGLTSVGGLADEMYDEDGIEDVLQEYLGERQLEDALTPILVTAYDIECRDTVFFKSWKAEHKNVLMRDAGRATSAAPTYFKPARVKLGEQHLSLIDGGIFMNSPAVSAYAEAKRLYSKRTEIMLVSLGTGELTRPIPYEDAKNWGKAGWLLPVLSCMSDGVADATDYQMKYFLEDRYYRFQTSLAKGNDDMDDASEANIDALKSLGRSLIKARKDDIDTLCEQLLA